MHSTDFDNAQDDRSMAKRVQNLEKIVVEQQHRMSIQQKIIEGQTQNPSPSAPPPSYQSSNIQQPYVSSGPVVDLEPERKVMEEEEHEYSDVSDDSECVEIDEDDHPVFISENPQVSRTLSVYSNQEAML